MSLASIQQQDFSAGMVRSVARHLIPANGAYDIVNGLLSDDGSVFRRAGSSYRSNAAFGAAIHWVWDGYIGDLQRTLFAGLLTDFGVLDADDATPINLGGTGLSGVPARATELGGILFIDGGTLYGGSRKTAVYSTGTVTTTNGSKTVTGSGTTWNTLVDRGMLFRTAAGERVYQVASVDSTTQITLRDPYEGTTGGGKAYTLSPLLTAASPYRSSSIYATAGGRLVSVEGNRIFISNGMTTAGIPQPHTMPSTPEYELPAGANGVGAIGLGDNLFVFTTAGVYRINNMALDATDDFGNQQRRIDHIYPTIIALAGGSIAVWQGSLIVPARDDVWVLDGTSSPVRLSANITPFYLAQGTVYQSAVHRGHFFMPMLSLTNDYLLLVCRLDKQAWTRLTNPGYLTGLTVTSAAGQLLGADTDTQRIVLLNYFNPSAALKNDAAGATHTFEVTTRDYQTGRSSMVENTVRRLRLWHETVDAGTDNPTISGLYSEGGSETALSGTAAEDDGTTPYAWHLASKTERIRFRLTSSSPAASMVLRALEFLVRPSGRT